MSFSIPKFDLKIWLLKIFSSLLVSPILNFFFIFPLPISIFQNLGSPLLKEEGRIHYVTDFSFAISMYVIWIFISDGLLTLPAKAVEE